MYWGFCPNCYPVRAGPQEIGSRDGIYEFTRLPTGGRRQMPNSPGAKATEK